MVPRRLRFALSLTQLVTFAVLLRSVALDRWITVAVSVLLLVAAHVAKRGRTWGVALSFALGVMLASVWALGIAPVGFAVAGLFAVRPFVMTFRHLARFDRGAAATLAVLASGIGALGAVAWKQYAFDLFRTFPFLAPSVYPHHGLALLAMIAVAVAGRRFLFAHGEAEAGMSAERDERIEDARIRVATSKATSEEDAALAELESELDGSSELPLRRRAG